MDTDKYLYEVGEENEVVLVDVPVCREYQVEDLGNNYFVLDETSKDIKISVTEGKFDGGEKEGFMLAGRLGKIELKPKPGEKSRLTKLLKKNRFVRNETEGMDNKLYSLLMTGATSALERGNTAIVTNNESLQDAYKLLVGNNSYLNCENFSMYLFNSDTSVEKIE